MVNREILSLVNIQRVKGLLPRLELCRHWAEASSVPFLQIWSVVIVEQKVQVGERRKEPGNGSKECEEYLKSNGGSNGPEGMRKSEYEFKIQNCIHRISLGQDSDPGFDANGCITVTWVTGSTLFSRQGVRHLPPLWRLWVQPCTFMAGGLKIVASH